jgi:hypothetical protein
MDCFLINLELVLGASLDVFLGVYCVHVVENNITSRYV